MKTTKQTEYASSDVAQTQDTENGIQKNNGAERAFTELERSVYAALETYANVHRGSGHNSLVSSQLYEHARGVVLEYMGLNKDKYIVIFSSPKRTSELISLLKPGSYQSITSREVGLPLGITAIAVEKKALPKGSPTECGGGTARLVAAGWIIWNTGPDKFEAGTPPIVNVIAFGKALLLLKRYGKDIFKKLPNNDLGITELLYKDDMEQYSGVELMEHLRKTLIGRGFIVPTLEGEKPFVNLDNSASTPTFQPIWNTFRQSLRLPERRKQDVVNEVKAVCSELLGAPLEKYDIIFTKNTTESINLVSESLGRSTDKDTEPAVLISLLEHSSNDLPWRMASKKSLVRLPVDSEGFVNLVELENSLREYNQDHKHGKKRIKIVALSGASNVLGTCNDIEKISPIVHKYGAKLLVDGAQVVAHKKVEMEKDEIDFLAFSAHKVYAPFGTGVLIARKGLLNHKADELKQIQSSGEENIGGVAALGKALVLLRRIGMDVVHEEEQALTRLALEGLSKVPHLKIFGIKDPNSSQFDKKIGVIVFETKDILHNKLAEEMFQKGGIGVRYGCHCSHLLIKHLLDINPVLEQVQRVVLTVSPKTQLPGVVRVSLGVENTKEDIDVLVDVLNRLTSQAKVKPNGDEKKAIAEAETEFQKELEEFSQTAVHRVYAYAE
ncbi:aminotransferase class V-fold PLP-dependent enzyme [Fulvivirga sp. 29W222]|uniref:Aminotransferase class V-fold PLP-dependent enzyme n=1 Tax=Fulvivirga marina TaxID=2494733 RepID=A0A937G2M7_9BACT|nr:aminotransferase class V-fold PLP-dependent enzyme [Fulvivirga marina]MBL6449557.1 aminotransferase class V-fold PLP-dependent enzyme [Fulvivirga marina]